LFLTKSQISVPAPRSCSLRNWILNSATAQETSAPWWRRKWLSHPRCLFFEAAGAPTNPKRYRAASALMNPRRVWRDVNRTHAFSYLTARARVSSTSDYTALLRKAMDFERAFVQAGGLLIAGLDPTATAAWWPLRDLREVELLVEAGSRLLRQSRLPPSTAQGFWERMRTFARSLQAKQADLMNP